MQVLLQALLIFSKRCHCAENYAFIVSVRTYKSKMQTGDIAKADEQRAMLIETFIVGGELQVNLPSWVVEDTIMRATRRSAHCFDAAGDEVCRLMSTDTWPTFTRSAEFLSLTALESRSAYSTAPMLRPAIPLMHSSGCVAYTQQKRWQQKLMAAERNTEYGNCNSSNSNCERVRCSTDSRLLKCNHTDSLRPAAPFDSVT
jgi:Regulator of G protein signaling domain